MHCPSWFIVLIKIGDKMKSPLIVALGCMVSGVLTFGCGGANQQTPAVEQPLVDENGTPLASVDGVWASRCQRDFSYVDGLKRGNDGDPTFQQATYTIRGGAVSFVIQKFADSQCTTGNAEVSNFQGHYQSQKNIPGERGAREVQLKFDTCKGDCKAYGPRGESVTQVHTTVFKANGDQFYTGTQSGGSLQWDYGEPFYRVGH